MGDFLFIISVVTNIGICFIVPLAGVFYFIKKKKSVKPFCIGVLVFYVSQILLRIPIMNNILVNLNGYDEFTRLYPILFSFLIALSAGVFEEIGRYLGFKYLLKNNRKFNDALIFGLGHGGIEAILFVGIPIFSLLSATDANTIFLSSIERVSAIIFHIGASVLVMYGINRGRKKYLLFAIGAHTIFNFVALVLMNMGFSILSVEGVLFGFAILSIVFMIKIKKNFEGDFVNEKIN